MNTVFHLRSISALLIFVLLTFSVQAEYYVVIGAFSKESNARKFTNKARNFFQDVSYSFNSQRNLYYVHVMKTARKEDARNWSLYLKHEKGLKDVWVFTDQLAGHYNDGVLAETGRPRRYYADAYPGIGANQRSGAFPYANPDNVDPRVWEAAVRLEVAHRLEAARAFEATQAALESGGRIGYNGRLKTADGLLSAGSLQLGETWETAEHFETADMAQSTGMFGLTRSMRESGGRYEPADQRSSAGMFGSMQQAESSNERQFAGMRESANQRPSAGVFGSMQQRESFNNERQSAGLPGTAGMRESGGRYESANKRPSAGVFGSMQQRESSNNERQSGGMRESAGRYTGEFESAGRDQSAGIFGSTAGEAEPGERQSNTMPGVARTFELAERLPASNRIESGQRSQSRGGLRSVENMPSSEAFESGGVLASAGMVQSALSLGSAHTPALAGISESDRALGTESTTSAERALGGVWTTKDGVKFMTGLQIASTIKEKAERVEAKVFTFTVEDHEGKIIPAEVMLVNYEKAKKITTFTAGDHVALQGTKKNQMLTMVCEVLGYSQETRMFNIDNLSRARDINENKNGVWEVRFKLKRMDINEVVVLNKTSFFEDAAVIQPSSRKELDELLGMMQTNPDYKILIHTHCSKGSKRAIKLSGKNSGYFDIKSAVVKQASDRKLTKERAAILRDYLVDHGIEKRRIDVMSWGSADKLVSRASPDAKFFNERIEIELLEAEEVKP